MVDELWGVVVAEDSEGAEAWCEACGNVCEEVDGVWFGASSFDVVAGESEEVWGDGGEGFEEGVEEWAGVPWAGEVDIGDVEDAKALEGRGNPWVSDVVLLDEEGGSPGGWGDHV